MWEGGGITGASDPRDKHLSRTAIAELSQGRLGDPQGPYFQLFPGKTWK